jgi:phosphoglycerol transferase MdoB-like AlkP superfamily enzyme
MFMRQNRPSLAGDALSALTGIQFNALFLLLTSRAVLSFLLVFTLLMLLMALNRIKERILHEPLVLSDAWLIPQIVIYPDMYFPYLPKGKMAVGILAALFLIGLEVFYEEKTALGALTILVLLCLAFLPFIAITLLRLGYIQKPAVKLLELLPVSHDAAKDAARNGPLAAALTHPVLAGVMKKNNPEWMKPDLTGHTLITPALTATWAARFPEALERLLAEIEQNVSKKRPHVALIQAESFCDIREYVQTGQREILQDFLPNWDKLRKEGRALPTPDNAYGAYTMRTEFSMLTGLQQEALGPWAFNPYILAAKRPLWSLAWSFRNLGYNTLCLHPYYRKFFRRDKVMRNLGFERFLRIEDMPALQCFGPYPSDRALTQVMLAEMEKAQKPLFCFAITMEAHGPWKKGRLTAEEVSATLGKVDGKLFGRALRQYLCHLKHEDQMFGNLRNAEQQRKIEVLAYGDHLPGCVEVNS